MGEFVGLPGLDARSQLAGALRGVGHDTPEPPADVAEGIDEAGELRAALRLAAVCLKAAGVTSPRADAEILACHLLGVDRGRLAVLALTGAEVPAGYGALVAARTERVPLQHLTGTAPFRHLELAVGPGVFVPRPETELVAQRAIDAALAVVAQGRAPIVVDLCTGSGAIALAVASEVQGSTVHAVELSPHAHGYARRNVAGTGVSLHHGDARTALVELEGRVDVVVSNPPYVPASEVPADAEVTVHDPDAALYGGGEDGLDLPRELVARAARLLRPGGTLVMEHTETQGAALRQSMTDAGFEDAATEADLTGRQRYTHAVLGGPRGVEESAS